MIRPRVYLAGPDVFLPTASAFAESKRQLCDTYGFVGVSPCDNEIDLTSLSKREAALRISAANEAMIRGCDLVIANLTPFRGPSADVGTVYEMGFARALGIPAFAYTNVACNLVDRTRQALGADAVKRPSGQFEDSFHMVIEDFDCMDNLMLVGAVEGSGARIIVKATPNDGRRFTDLSAFEECLKLAAQQPSLGIFPTDVRW
ncbi:nucleoside 2-deoxyribosyltransferase [Bradyrhizobium sp. RT5a]|uniref:nucleoside 2-deoxyribosyltransferase n=1 Tax=unclassified Bradyrhizobium TaxID=2631580 RepID=UPI003392261A